MSLARQQHEVPRFYLEHFACKHSGRVEAYDFRVKKSVIQLPEKLARVRDSYVFTGKDGKPDHSVDKLLGEIENEVTLPIDGTSVYEKVLAAQNVTDDERLLFAHFIASMYVRSPTTRRLVAEWRASVIGQHMRDVAADDAKWAEREAEFRTLGTLDPDNAARARQRFLSQDYQLVMPHEESLMVVDGLPTTAERVYKMSWSFLRAGRGDFITCDSPLAHIASRLAPGGHVEFTDRHSMLTLPLSSSVCWVAHWNPSAPRVRRAKQWQIDGFNSLRALNAQRQLYAVPHTNNLVGLASVRDKPNPLFQFDSVIPNKRPQVHVVRKPKK